MHGAAIAPPGLSPFSGLRPLLSLLSPQGARGRLTVLIFHRVHAAPDPLFPGEMHAVTFRERMEWLREWFNVLPLDEAVDRLARANLPARAAAITFDDGYRDNHAIAFPILRELRLSATFFIATDFLDGGRMWNDSVIEAVRRTPQPVLDLSRIGLGVYPVDAIEVRRRAIGELLDRLKYLPPHARDDAVSGIVAACGLPLPNDLMMGADHVRDLADADMGIGAHTRSHPILASLVDEDARREIVEGLGALQSITGRRPKLFAYPNGKPGRDYQPVHVKMAREAGFAAAFSTSPGAASRAADRFELPRFTPWDRTRARWGLRLTRNLMTPLHHART